MGCCDSKVAVPQRTAPAPQRPKPAAAVEEEAAKPTGPHGEANPAAGGANGGCPRSLEGPAAGEAKADEEKPLESEVEQCSTPRLIALRRGPVSKRLVKQHGDAERLLKHGSWRNRPMTSSEFLGFLRMAPAEADELFFAGDCTPGGGAPATPAVATTLNMELHYSDATAAAPATGARESVTPVPPPSTGPAAAGATPLTRQKSYMRAFSGGGVEGVDDSPVLERAHTYTEEAHPRPPSTAERSLVGTRLSFFRSPGKALAPPAADESPASVEGTSPAGSPRSLSRLETSQAALLPPEC